MVQHLSSRLVWHDSGWNGRVCENPARNSSCSIHDHIREEKDDTYEEEVAGERLNELEADLPPCSADTGAFSPTEYTHLHTDPLEWRGNSPRSEKIPPYSFCTTPYGELRDESADYGWVEGKGEDVDIMNDFFSQLEPDLSLVFFYSKDKHPLTEDGGRVLVGVGRISDIGDQVYYPNSDDAVWSRRISQNYPDEGVRLPYQEYIDAGHSVEDILCRVPPSANESFSFVGERVSDDTAVGILERLLESLRTVKRENHVDGDWDAKIEWVETVLQEAWENRGMYPGLEGVLGYLECDGTQYQRRVLSHMIEGSENPLEHVVRVLENEESARDPVEDYEFLIARQKWDNLSEEKKDLLETLTGFALTETQVERIMRSVDASEDHERSISVSLGDLRDNLYLLAERDPGGENSEPIGFETIDRGLRLDVSDLTASPPGFLTPVTREDKRRVRALLVAVLEHASQQGDTALAIEEAVSRAREHLPDERQCRPTIGDVTDEFEFYEESLEISEGAEGTSIALPRLHAMETEVAETIRNLSSQTVVPQPQNENGDADSDRNEDQSGAKDEATEWRSVLDSVLGEVDAEELDEELEEMARSEKTSALETLHRSRFSVLTGGAGTGKTTVVRAFLQGLKESEGQRSSLLLAPTGKARVRLEQAAEVEAKTIHQFLYRKGWIRRDGDFSLKDEGEETGGARTVIIDEASMISLDLLATLFRALDMDLVRRLVLIGDPNQLPPIGPGRPFFDTIRWLEGNASERVAELEQRVRYRGEARAARDLAEVFAGENPELNDGILADVAKGTTGSDLEVRFWDDDDHLYEQLGEVLEDILEKYGGASDSFEAFDRSVGYESAPGEIESWQILTPTNVDMYGTRALNRKIQAQYRGFRLMDDSIESVGDEQFVPGDKVIQTQNNTERSPYTNSWEYVANGEIGVVTETRSGETYRVYTQFSTRRRSRAYKRTDLRTDSRLELAYGLTVHKAQGSDFETVVLILPQEAATLSRELLYTGLTRYRQRLILLVERDTSKLFELSKPESSAIRKRNTRLFTPSIRSSEEVPYPENLIHRTNDETTVRSKSEVIVADTLSRLEISYDYEKKLKPEGSDDYRWPDFTVYHQGEVYYWEHLGMLHVPEYREKWEEKQEWYVEHGLAERLVTSRDTPEGGIDSAAIEEIARENILSE